MKNKNLLIIEIILSILVTAFILFVIMFACVKIKNKKSGINKNAEATLIMTSIIENMNSKTFFEFESYIEDVSNIGISKTIEGQIQTINVNGSELQGNFLGTEIPKDYEIELRINGENDIFNVAKEVSVIIYFDNENNQKENLEMTTIIQREKIDECNAPIINSTYFENIDINTEYYNIIPIKYSYESNSYVKTEESDDEWYNYSAKEWARVLVFSKEDYNLADIFIDSNGIVRNTVKYGDYTLELKNYMYIWIPNFSIKNNDSYFRYASSKRAIEMDFIYAEDKYLYLNTLTDEIKDISSKCSFNGIYGVWRKVVGDEEDEYYRNFNMTKYAPLNLHL